MSDGAKGNMIIRVCELTKKFKETTALDGVDLTFQKGQIHGIIGRNGSGKSKNAPRN